MNEVPNDDLERGVDPGPATSSPIPIPDALPTCFGRPPADLVDQVLGLYRRIAEYQRLLKHAATEAAAERAALERKTDRVIAALAAERFEFERLRKRLQSVLEGAERDKDALALKLFADHWDQDLQRWRIAVHDLDGLPLDDALAEVVDVKSYISDAQAERSTVRQTLTPLVRFEDRVVGIAQVITTVRAPTPQPEISEGT